METYFISKPNFESLLRKISRKFAFYAPREKANFLFYERIEPDSVENITLGEIRPIQPLKSFLIPPRRKVGEYFSSSLTSSSGEKVILGAKTCDLESLRILDNVYADGDFRDPFYIKERKNMILISSDCTRPQDTCFCSLLDLTPYPKEGFDLNLSAVEGGFVLEVGSEKGKRIVEGNKGLIEKITKEHLTERDKNRQDVLNQVKKINKDFKSDKSFREIIKDSFDSPVWEEAVERCVDCGGCNHICPTCRCFLLFDEKTKEGFSRTALWDACLYTGFARVAAGANPRIKLSQRFANRLLCKFSFFPEDLGLDACTGCGRCISVCIGKIDMREVVRDLRVKSLTTGRANGKSLSTNKS